MGIYDIIDSYNLNWTERYKVLLKWHEI